MNVAYSIPFTNYDEVSRELESSKLNVALTFYSLGKKTDVKGAYQLPPERIISVHGPGLPLVKENLPVFRKAAKIALALGQNSMVLHPHRAKNPDESERLRQQEEALGCIDNIAETTGCKVEVETFAGAGRVLRPAEIIEKGLPMVLDISHLDSLQCYDFVLRNAPSTIHLSERINDVNHQPIGNYGESLVEILQQQGWGGPLCLEYMPDLRAESKRDTAYLLNVVSGAETAQKNSLLEAGEKFRKASEIKPEGYLGDYGLGMVLVREQKYAEAVPHLKKALEKFPSHSSSLLFLSMAQHALGQHQEAKQTEEKLNTINSELGRFLNGIQSHL